MCQFFSCISNGKGKIWYFDAEMRQAIRDGKYSKYFYQEDSHTSIADFYKTEIQEDYSNKYEYNPITGVFRVDGIYAKTDDSHIVLPKLRKLDFNTVIPNWVYVEDILKKIYDYKPKSPITATTIPDKNRIREIREIMASMWTSVGDSVWASIVDIVLFPQAPVPPRTLEDMFEEILQYMGIFPTP